jgi:cyanophycin synthetase
MADLAERLDVQGRRIIVISAPGDRRDEDVVAIAEAVAGRFDHYICRRDDSLRGRDGDEIPGMIAKVLRARGAAESAISIIPDEQEAIEAALRMGKQGDLLLIFADALARSWKQVTKFRPAGAAPASEGKTPAPKTSRPAGNTGDEAVEELAGGNTSGDAALEAAGFIRDERGLRFIKESDD